MGSKIKVNKFFVKLSVNEQPNFRQNERSTLNILNSSAARRLFFGKFSGEYKLIMGHHYYQFLYCFQQHNYFSTVFLEECCADLQNSQKYISYFSIILLRYDIISIG